MGRVSAVDSHPQRDRIVADILDGIGATAISRKWGIARNAVDKFQHKHLSKANVAAAHSLRDGKSIIAKIEETVTLLGKMSKSLDEYLRDPEDPTRYTMDPQAGDIEVVYTDVITDPNNPDKTVRIKRRGSLQSMYDVIKNATEGYDFNLSIKRDDSRRIFIMTLQAVNEAIGQITKLWSIVAEAKQNVTRSDVFALFMQAIMRATKDHPDMLAAISAEFEAEGRRDPAKPPSA